MTISTMGNSPKDIWEIFQATLPIPKLRALKGLDGFKGWAQGYIPPFNDQSCVRSLLPEISPPSLSCHNHGSLWTQTQFWREQVLRVGGIYVCQL